MKQDFLLRIGSVNTPPRLRGSKTDTMRLAQLPAIFPLLNSVAHRLLIGFSSVSHRFLSMSLRCPARVITLLLGVLMSVNVWGADFTKSNSWNFSTSGNNDWTSTNCGSYCGGWGKNKDASPSVSKSNITDFSDVNFSLYENVSLTIDVTAATNDGTNSYTVTLIDKNGNQVSTYTSTKTNGMGSGSNASSVKKSSVTFSPTQAFSGYKIQFNPKAFITQTGYTLTYDNKAAATPVTSLILSEAGDETDLKNGKNIGDKYTLPSSTKAVCGVKKLAGWSTVEITNPIENKPTSNFYELGAQVMLKENNKFYAVFADKEGDGEPNEYIKGTKSDLKEGSKLIVVNSTNAMSNSASDTKLSPVTVTVNSNKITSPAASIIWEVSISDGKYILQNGGKYLRATANNNLALSTTSDSWTIGTSNSKYTFTSANCSKQLEYYSNLFTVYSTGTSSAYLMDMYINNISFSNYTTTCSSDPLIEGLTITPSAEPTEGLYWSPITATISCTTTGVTIKYSLDGTDPSIPYTIGTNIDITATSTLKVKATKSGHQDASKSQTFTFGKVYADVDAYLADKANIADYEKIKINYLRVTITSIASTKETVNFSGASLHVSDVDCPTNWAINGILVAKNQIYTARKWNDPSYQLRPSAWTVFTYVTNLPNVTGLGEENVTSSSVTLKWTAVTNAGSYKVKFNGEEKDATTETSMTISDLNYNTQYSWYVKALTSDLDVATDGNYGYSAKTVKTLDVPHTVTFHAGDKGTCATTSLTETETGVGVTLPEVTNVATGYDFKGWSTSETPTSANAGVAGATYKPADDIDLYAYYTPQVYTISYQDKGGVTYSGSNLASLPKKHTYNVATTLTEGVKTGHHFDGWFDNAECTGDPMTAVAANSYSTHFTLYAKWTINSYKLTWELNGGTIKTEGTPSEDVVYATELKAPELEKTGYTYVWYPTVPATMPASDATYSAMWSANIYDITYLDKGGTIFTGTHDANYPTRHTYGTPTNLDSPTKANFDFVGWYIKSDCSGEPLTSLAATGYLDNITLYAKWNEHDKFTVTFVDDVQDTDCSAWDMKDTYVNTQIVFKSIGDKTRKVPDGDCVTDHYHFVGWIEDGTIPTKEPDNVIKAGTTTIKVSKNVTYKAVWAKEL